MSEVILGMFMDVGHFKAFLHNAKEVNRDHLFIRKFWVGIMAEPFTILP